VLTALSLYLACGLLAGLLAGLLGVGGGLIVVPGLLMAFTLLGFDASVATHLAIGTSLATIVPTGASSVIAHMRHDAVDWPTVGRMLPGLVLGSVVGGLFADRVDGRWLQFGFGLFALFVVWRLLRGQVVKTVYRRASRSTYLGGGMGIGAVSSLVGIGGGSLSVPWLSGRGLEMARAVATSSALGLPIAFAGAVTYTLSGRGAAGLPAGATGYVYWPAFFAVIVASVSMAPRGAALAHRVSRSRLKRVFAVFLLLVGVKLIVGAIRSVV